MADLFLMQGLGGVAARSVGISRVEFAVLLTRKIKPPRGWWLNGPAVVVGETIFLRKGVGESSGGYSPVGRGVPAGLVPAFGCA